MTANAPVLPVPNSSGTTRPRSRAPGNACDSHIHIYDSRFPLKWPNLRAVENASVAEYKRLQERNGTTRTIVVQPAAYGIDNSVTLDAVAQLGEQNARGIAVVHPTVTDTGARRDGQGRHPRTAFHAASARTAVTTAEMIEPLAHRAHRLGWHVQFLRADQIVEMADLIGRGAPSSSTTWDECRSPGIHHPAFKILRRLARRGRAWVKLGPYLDTKEGARGDIAHVARALAEHAPERCVWAAVACIRPSSNVKLPTTLVLSTQPAGMVDRRSERRDAGLANPAAALRLLKSTPSSSSSSSWSCSGTSRAVRF